MWWHGTAGAVRQGVRLDYIKLFLNFYLCVHRRYNCAERVRTEDGRAAG